jgi:hypothetical protein
MICRSVASRSLFVTVATFCPPSDTAGRFDASTLRRFVAGL